MRNFIEATGTPGFLIKMAKTRDVKSPERGTEYSAGLDFFIPNTWNETNPYYIGVGENVVIPMGIYVDLLGSELENYMMMFENKSGVAVKRGLLVGAKVIDADYQGELMVNIHNPSDAIRKINPGDKIIQGILIPVKYSTPDVYDSLDDLYTLGTSSRGAGRFGSTGEN